VCKEELRQAKARAGKDEGSNSRMHRSVFERVHDQLDGLSKEELESTRRDVTQKLEGGVSERYVDVDA
jgi:hypothetical protein